MLSTNRFPLRIPTALFALLLLFCICLTSCAGCGGCSKQTESETTDTDGINVSSATSAKDNPPESGIENESSGAEETSAPIDSESKETGETTVEIKDVMTGEVLDAPYASDFHVSNVFSSDMVVQRGEFLRIWGTAEQSENGKKVSGTFMGMFAEAIVQDGVWEITFGARLSACAELGHSMRIYTDQKEIVFENVLVGDVYMVIGQSNCAYSIYDHHTFCNTDENGGKNTLDYAAPIRLHYNSLTQTQGYPTRGTEEVCTEVVSDTTWIRADSYPAIYRFSAIGYFFACHYLKLTDNSVPIGLIEIDGNGQPLGAFLPNQVANELKSDKWNQSKGYYVTTGVNADAGRYLYNHYMFPFERYAIAGVLWYQGESDLAQTNAKNYVERFSALITYMRSTHNLVNRDFPVYFMEFPSCYPAPTGTTLWAYMDFALIRAVMGSIPQTLSNSYQVVSCDLWSDQTFWNSLHPNCKYEQARRAASLAAAVLGEGGQIDTATGPILVDIELSADGKTAVLTYENVGSGLQTSDGGTAVKGFCLYQKSCKFNTRANVTATITAYNQITVTASSSIQGIAYNYKTDSFYGKDINLCNSYGMPAGAVTMLVKSE